MRSEPQRVSESMSDAEPTQRSASEPHHVSLPVLPHSGKVEQLKNEFKAESGGHGGAGGAAAAPPKPFVDSSILYIPHVNKTRPTPERTPEQRAVEEKVILALRDVYDPEIPVNLYDLGLIYDILVNEKNEVRVIMTLTAPGCPVAGTLPPMVESKVENIPEVTSATVELVWQPTWTREMMSEVARLELGL